MSRVMTRLIRDRYEPLRVAGHGAQGQVLQALDHVHDRLVALKVRAVADDADREAVLREARVLLGLTPHAGVPLVREDFFVDDRYYVVMDWIEGPDLRSVLDKRGRPGLPFDAVVSHLEQVARALDHLHGHSPPIVHRDVKPSNVLLTIDRGAVLVDFGLSGRTGVGGTPGYVAPEVIAGGEGTPASDVYALAATAFVLLAGSPPRPGATLAPSELGGHDLDLVRAAIAAGLDMSPARRPPGATAFIEALRGEGPAVTPLPGPTATLVFTDIEGSTRLFRELGDLYLEVLHDHHRLVRTAVAVYGGHEVKTEGDSFFLAFADPRDAVAACLEAQRALVAHEWPAGATLRVRMGVHTGEVHVVGRDYVGLPVHEAARICAAAHGGQVLVSDATASGIDGGLPSLAELAGLGPHSLRDFPEPRSLFQLRHPELPEEFPPIRTAAAERTLPTFSTSLVGREDESAAAVEMLRDGTRLLTFIGPGGIGKTRLAVEVADRMRSHLPAVWFVPLARVDDEEALMTAIAESTGTRSGKDTLAAVVSVLSGGPGLLVLDNFEHLVDSAPVVAGLLDACPQLGVLVTSRERLRLREERAVEVAPLSVRASGHEVVSSAMELFAERARAVDPDFAITDGNAGAVSELCRRLDGLPLALELAAARVRVFSPGALLERLSLDLLASSERDVSERQRSLRGAIAWSYGLLDPSEASAFRRFAVFAGGATLPAAESVLADPSALATFESLLDKSLLTSERGPGGEPRLGMLETVREFAIEQLVESGEADDAGLRHARWYASWAERATGHLAGHEQARWLALIDSDHDNLRIAMQRGMPDPDIGLRLASSLTRFWSVRGYWSEGRRLLEAALAVEGGPPEVRARALLGAGHLSVSGRDYEAAREYTESGLEAYRSLGDVVGIGRALNQIGELERWLGRDVEAREHYDEALTVLRRAGDRHGCAQVLANQAALLLERLELDHVVPPLEKALEVMRDVGDRRSTARILSMLGLAHRHRHELDDAHRLLEESVTECSAVGDASLLGDALQNLALVTFDRDDRPAAVALLEESLAVNRELRNRPRVAQLLFNLGSLSDDNSRAKALYAESYALARELSEREIRGSLLLSLGVAAQRLDDDDWSRACLEEAVEHFTDTGDRVGLAYAIGALGILAERAGDVATANDLLEQSAAMHDDLGRTQDAAECRERIREVG